MRPRSISEPKTQRGRLNRKNKNKPLKPAKRKLIKAAPASQTRKPNTWNSKLPSKTTSRPSSPAHTPVPFDQIKGVLKVAIEEVFGRSDLYDSRNWAANRQRAATEARP